MFEEGGGCADVVEHSPALCLASSVCGDITGVSQHPSQPSLPVCPSQPSLPVCPPYLTVHTVCMQTPAVIGN